MNTKMIKEILQIFEESDLAKMELEVDNMKIAMEKPLSNMAVLQKGSQSLQDAEVISGVQNEATTFLEKKGTWIKAPIVGTFYSSKSEGGTPFIEINQRVKKGDVVCIIDAMKVLNEIHAPCDGIVQEILVTNESMVEFDQELIRIGEAND